LDHKEVDDERVRLTENTVANVVVFDGDFCSFRPIIPAIEDVVCRAVVVGAGIASMHAA
jgi:hypothetical protein